MLGIAEDNKTNEHVSRLTGEMKYVHVARVIKNYKGNTNRGEFILITTPVHSCGKILTRGKWLVSMTPALSNGTEKEGGALGVYETSFCDYNKSLYSLTKRERVFLSTRMFCDEQGTCTCGTGSLAMVCKMSPCLSSTCDKEGVQCIDNYCGCRAEWVDNTTGQLECDCMKEDSICRRG